MAERVVPFGIIGAGLMGREFAVATARWSALLDLDVRPHIVAVCDANPSLLPWYTSNFPSIAQTTGDYRELLANDAVEAVYCAVPHHLHEEIYLAILAAGKHLMGEKPFGIDRAANARIMEGIRAHPELFVRCSSEFPFYPGAQRVIETVRHDDIGEIIEVRSGLLHSSDLDPDKVINWKRIIEFNGEYGCMGDLGMHAVHLPFRLGWYPVDVRALLSNLVPERIDRNSKRVPCATWDNAILACEVDRGGRRFPMILETKRISPGDMNTWYVEVIGTRRSVKYSTKAPKTLWTMEYAPGGEQAWQTMDLGHRSAYRTITGEIFEFGFPDAILQMWAAFLDEYVHRDEMIGNFRCATPEEAARSHDLFTAALESQRMGSTARVGA